MMVMLALPAVLAGTTAVKRLQGPAIATGDIDATVVRLMSAAQVTGVGLAVFNDGRPVFLKAYGVRDKGGNLPLTVDSVMTAASFSKSAFAYLVLQLVDEGVIDLDTPVQRYLPRPLPTYRGYESLSEDPRYARITPRMLLTHTSGFANLRVLEPDRLLHLHFDPGSRYAYSGEGINLLQLVVETVTGSPVETLMREHIFQPFEMTRTSMVWQSRFETDYANGYDEYGRSLGPERRTTASAAGSMQTTLSDFARFLQAAASGKRLRPHTRAQMTAPQVRITTKHQFPTLRFEATEENESIRLSYGLGWGVYSTTHGKAFFKEGHDEGWRHYAVFFEKSGTGLVMMTNSSNGEGIFQELLETVIGNTFTPIEWEGFTPYQRLPSRAPLPQHRVVSVSADHLERYVGRYRFSPDIIITITRRGDHLAVQENDEPSQEIFPESDGDFFSNVADDMFTFVPDNKQLVFRTGGKQFTGTRIE
jgi:CubicO group peptidase (beta-lactamase class C family)